MPRLDQPERAAHAHLGHDGVEVGGQPSGRRERVEVADRVERPLDVAAVVADVPAQTPAGCRWISRPRSNSISRISLLRSSTDAGSM